MLKVHYIILTEHYLNKYLDYYKLNAWEKSGNQKKNWNQ